jgi:murein DD-endopeptidase MepM/ murein hydrolase activator NlpD
MLAMLLACGLNANSQTPEQDTFTPPFDFPMSFSGNFGEIRSAHFHGGLDFKTGGEIRKRVLAVADGYISRIRVTNGSGCMLYVAYNNGYTTINRHLEAFMPTIAKRVRQLQQQAESYEIDITPSPDEYPVKQGEQIAWSGNRGYSMGPHLHLDVMETATGDFVDPIPLFPAIQDNLPPKAESIMITARDDKGTLRGNTHTKVFRPESGTVTEAWGDIGCALKAYDYMNGAANRCGVRSVTLTIDGDTVSNSTVDRFSQEESKMVDSWTTAGYMKSYFEPNNPLRMLHDNNGNRGWITIDQERDYHLTYILTDAKGNTSKYRFTIRGKKMDIRQSSHKEKYRFEWNKTNVLHEPGLTFTVPNGAIYDDINLNFSIHGDSGSIAFQYRLHDKPIRTRETCDIAIGLRKMPVPDTTKYYVKMVGGGSVGGTYKDGFIHAKINRLGTYTVAIDTVPPQISSVNKNRWTSNKKISFSIRDAATGISSYRGTIDGKFALFYRPNLTSTQYYCDLDPEYIKKGGTHHIVIEATDGCGNRRIVKDSFVW